MNEYINNFHSHSPTKWSHYYCFLTSLMEVSCLMSSYCFCNAQLFITNPNPNPETAFFQKSDKPQPRQHVLLTPIWICAFLHAYSPHPTLPCFWAFCSLMHLKMFIINFLLHIMMAGAISICPFNCVRLEKYCHLGDTSGWVSEKWG